MKRLPAPIGKRDSAMALAFGVALLSMLVLIAWRWMLE